MKGIHFRKIDIKPVEERVEHANAVASSWCKTWCRNCAQKEEDRFAFEHHNKTELGDNNNARSSRKRVTWARWLVPRPQKVRWELVARNLPSGMEAAASLRVNKECLR